MSHWVRWGHPKESEEVLGHCECGFSVEVLWRDGWLWEAEARALRDGGVKRTNCREFVSAFAARQHVEDWHLELAAAIHE